MTCPGTICVHDELPRNLGVQFQGHVLRDWRQVNFHAIRLRLHFQVSQFWTVHRGPACGAPLAGDADGSRIRTALGIESICTTADFLPGDSVKKEQEAPPFQKRTRS